MEPKELLKTLVDELRQLAQAETIISEPITTAGKTIIPVTRIMLGFGGGSGEGTAPGNAGAPSGGGGGGGGLKIEPAAFIVIEDEKVSVLAVPSPRGKLDTLIEAVPDLIAKFSEMKAKRGEKAEKEKENEKGGKREEKK